MNKQTELENAMNKQAKKLKERRREERREQKQKEMNDIVNNFNQYQASVGKRTDFPPDMIYRKYREIEREYIVKATMITAMTSMYVLNIKHNFGYKRLYEYAKRLTDFVNAIDRGDRTIEQLRNEILDETGVDGSELEKSNACAEKAMLYRCSSGGLILTLYHMYFDRGWKNVRLRRLYYEIIDMLKEVILNGRDQEVRSFLFKKFGVWFGERGEIRFELEENMK
jgi:hypothetical protein